MAKLTKDKIQEIVRGYVQEVLDEDAEYRAVSKPRTRNALEAQEFGLWSVQGDTREALALNDYSMADSLITRWEILRKHGIEGVGKSDASYKMLCRAMMEGFLDIGEVLLAREVGDHNKEREIVAQLFPPEPAPQQAKPIEAEDTVGDPLSKVIEAYIEEHKRGWTEKTLTERRGAYSTFQEFIGKDVDIKTIDRRMISEFKTALLQLPPRRKVRAKYKHRTMKQLLKMSIPENDRLSPATVNDILSCIKSVFSHAAVNGLIDRDPAEGIKAADKRRDRDKRQHFTKEDLALLFNAPGYREDTFLKSYMYWCPIMALYTGARLNEIASLYLEDFIQVGGGVWCIDINENTKDKRLKNLASARVVPLHPFLVDDLGLIHYVEQQRKHKIKRLFPELSKQRDGYGKSVGSWFQRYKKTLGFPADGKKAFHSFRHTFITTLKHAGVPELIANELDGHSSGKTISYSTYGGRFSPKQLYEEGILKLTYNLDLSHLKASKYSGNR